MSVKFNKFKVDGLEDCKILSVNFITALNRLSSITVNISAGTKPPIIDFDKTYTISLGNRKITNLSISDAYTSTYNIDEPLYILEMVHKPLYITMWSTDLRVYYNQTYGDILKDIFKNTIDVNISEKPEIFISQNRSNEMILKDICQRTGNHFLHLDNGTIKVGSFESFKKPKLDNVIVTYYEGLNIPYLKYTTEQTIVKYNKNNPTLPPKLSGASELHVFATRYLGASFRVHLQIQGEALITENMNIGTKISYMNKNYFVVGLTTCEDKYSFHAVLHQPVIELNGSNCQLNAQRAIVTKNEVDDHNRVFVKLINDPKEVSIPVSVVSSIAEDKAGTLWLPRKNTEVLIEFIEDNEPVIVGCLYNIMNKHALNRNQYGYYIEEQKWYIDNEKKSMNMYADQYNANIKKDCIINVQENTNVTIYNGNVTLKIDKGQLNIYTKDQINISSDNNINFKSSDFNINCSNFNVQAQNINMKSDDSIKANARMAFNIDSMSANIKTKTELNLEGLNTNIQGKAMLNIEGATTNVKGKAMIAIEAPILNMNAKAAAAIKGAIVAIDANALLKIESKGAMIQKSSVMILQSSLATVIGMFIVTQGLVRQGFPF